MWPVLCNLTNTSRCAPCWWGGGAGAVRAVPEPCPRNLSRIQCEMSPWPAKLTHYAGATPTLITPDTLPLQIVLCSWLDAIPDFIVFEPCTLAAGLFMYFLQILCTALPMLGKTLSKVRNVPLESFKIQPGVEHHKSKIGHFKWTLETNLCRSLYFFSIVPSVFLC